MTSTKRLRLSDESICHRGGLAPLPDDVAAAILTFLSPWELQRLLAVHKSWRALVQRSLQLATVLDLDQTWQAALATDLNRGRVLGFLQSAMNPRRINQLFVSCSEALESVPFAQALGDMLVGVKVATVDPPLAKTKAGITALCAELKNLTELVLLPAGGGRVELACRPLSKFAALLRPTFLSGWLHCDVLKELTVTAWDLQDNSIETLLRCTNLESLQIMIPDGTNTATFMDAIAKTLSGSIRNVSSLVFSQLGPDVVPLQFRWLNDFRSLTKLKLFQFRHVSSDKRKTNVYMTEADVDLFYGALAAWSQLADFEPTGPMAVPPVFFSKAEFRSDKLSIGVKPVDSKSVYPMRHLTNWLKRFPRSWLQRQRFTMHCEITDEVVEWAPIGDRIWSACEPRFRLDKATKMSQQLLNEMIRHAGTTVLRFSGDDEAIEKALRSLAPHLHSAVVVALNIPRGVSAGMIMALQTLPFLVVLSVNRIRFELDDWLAFLKGGPRCLSRMSQSVLDLPVDVCNQLRDECKDRSAEPILAIWSNLTSTTEASMATRTVDGVAYGLSVWHAPGKIEYERWVTRAVP